MLGDIYYLLIWKFRQKKIYLNVHITYQESEKLNYDQFFFLCLKNIWDTISLDLINPGLGRVALIQ